MAIRCIKIAMDGATGRLGGTQHLAQSVLPIRDAGGLELSNGDRIVPIPILLGRNPEKLAALASTHGGLEWSADVEACLARPDVDIYFDATATEGRAARASMAIEAGKHIYLEKPVAGTVEEAVTLVRAATAAGLKNGSVQDKLFLPGLRKLAKLRESGFFGKIYSMRIEFGWWIFDGASAPAQRSSWNYRKVDGGGLILDMFPHWRYIIEHLVGTIRSVCCRAQTRVPRRWDEEGKDYTVDVEDDVFAIFELEGEVLAQVGSSWATRVRRDDLLQIQIDGSDGSAVAGLHRCFVQPLAATPKPVWNAEMPLDTDFERHWREVPDVEDSGNPYRRGWELFLRHVADDAPFPFPLIEGARGVQLAEACYRSNAERRWVELPVLD